MNHTLKAAFAAMLALVMALTAIPVSALPRYEAEAEVEPYWTVPDGYNAHDYNKCVQFLEQTDEDGVKNGEKLSENYDPNDPETWGSNNFIWSTVNGERRVYLIDISYRYLSGSLDLSGCTALEDLKCYFNNLSVLDASSCTALEYLSCTYNNLSILDASSCTALEWLFCDVNNVAELNIASCSTLKMLSCRYNNLTELDITQSPALYELECSSNNLAELDITQNTALELVNCDSNNLTELDITQNTALMQLSCSFNNLTELDVTQNTALELLNCSSNNLTELDVTQNTALYRLNCSSNNLTELDVTQNHELYHLNCSSNNLTELDVTQNTALAELGCISNDLTELNLSNNPLLSFDHIRAEGAGFIGFFYNTVIYAYPVNGAEFYGLYDDNGTLVSEGEWSDYYEAYCYEFESNSIPTGTVIARFSGGAAVPGDLDGNGSVTTADAITTLRLAMQIIDGGGMNTDAADMDGNGSITLADAIIILRTAMGLA